MTFETKTLLGGAVVTGNFQKASICKKCKQSIFWAVTKNLKNIPIQKDVNGNWIAHFAVCTFAKDFRKNDALDELEAQKKRESWFSK